MVDDAGQGKDRGRLDGSGSESSGVDAGRRGFLKSALAAGGVARRGRAIRQPGRVSLASSIGNGAGLW